jgi:dCTP deaminase
MILSSREIIRRLGDHSKNGALIIRPYGKECQQPASYDLRMAEDTVLKPGSCTLAHTLEWLELPSDLAATIRTRSSYGRRGILVTAGFVDPGFRGQLTLGLVNMGREAVHLKMNDRVVQLILQEVLEADQTYEGRYQDSMGIVGAR